MGGQKKERAIPKESPLEVPRCLEGGEVAESFIGFGHLVDVVSPLDGSTSVVACVYQFHRKTARHGHALLLASVAD